MYRAYGLLPPGHGFHLEDAYSQLKARFPDPYTLTLADASITISRDDWEMVVSLNSSPEVLQESLGFAEKIAGASDGLDIESCNSRVEVSSDSADPFVEHLGDFHAVIEVLRGFSGIILIDPKEPALM